jgi:hypothetical protein
VPRQISHLGATRKGVIGQAILIPVGRDRPAHRSENSYFWAKGPVSGKPTSQDLGRGLPSNHSSNHNSGADSWEQSESCDRRGHQSALCAPYTRKSEPNCVPIPLRTLPRAGRRGRYFVPTESPVGALASRSKLISSGLIWPDLANCLRIASQPWQFP